ncbi:transcription factor jun-D [Varanus komodoensis]|uniref:transcription factor jun-D n=1 Tax=Varanus komodoensis TaxID=61221 RepID=UPI001CF78763|nr:transcription factor jun-D [Varanus komodoensis]
MDVPFYHDDVLIALAAAAAAAAAPSPAGGPSGSAPAQPCADGGRMKKDGLSLALGELKAPAGAPAPAPGASSAPPGDGEGRALLASPDLGLLKLASPELERLIIQSNGLVTTTPTSGGAHFPFPKAGGGGAAAAAGGGGGGSAAPDEQEFAAGFVKALEDLHYQSQQLGGGGGGPVGGELPPAASLAPPASQPRPPAPVVEPPVYANLSTFAGAYAAAEGPFQAHSRLPPPPPPPPLKDEPQIVPEVASFGDSSPPLSPIDMDTQERIKAERKRLRNRIAASKCRRRKLERISRLEEKVRSLKSQNTELASTANLLREQVAQLKQKVLSHVNSGCQLLPHQPPVPAPHQVPAY